MAPLTRNRAAPGQVPSDLAVEYYRQRASAGLIITEASQVSPEGQGYVDTPGIYNAEQVAGWRRVTDAVHAEGGRIVVQLWHVGRISHVSLQPNGQRAGFVDRAARRDQDLHPRRLRPGVDAARARNRRDPSPDRELPRRGAARDGRGLRRRRGPWRERLPDRPVPARQHQRPQRRIRRRDREPHTAARRSDAGRRRRDRRRPHRAAPVAGDAIQRRRAGQRSAGAVRTCGRAARAAATRLRRSGRRPDRRRARLRTVRLCRAAPPVQRRLDGQQRLPAADGARGRRLGRGRSRLVRAPVHRQPRSRPPPARERAAQRARLRARFYGGGAKGYVDYPTLDLHATA